MTRPPLAGTARLEFRMRVVDDADQQIMPVSTGNTVVKLRRPDSTEETIGDFDVPEPGVVRFYRDVDVPGQYAAAAKYSDPAGGQYPTTELRRTVRGSMFRK
jgi:hypothetical protein